MASMGGHLDPDPVIRTVQNGKLLVRHLTSICTAEGISKSGNKVELQNRVVQRVKLHASTNRADSFERMKQMVYHPESIQNLSPTPYQNPMGSSYPPNGRPAIHNPYAGNAYNGAYPPLPGKLYPVGSPRIDYKTSPFYEFLEQLGGPTLCDVMAHVRHTVKIPLSVSRYPSLAQVSKDGDAHKVMVFCANDGQGPQDITFPHQSEIKVNGGDVKANLRGLKNKAGSTRPVDISTYLRYTPEQYSNTVEMTFALTNKAGAVHKFYMAIYIVKPIGVQTLVEKLKAGKRITAEHVIDQMVSKARDADIVQTASVLSLKCPISTKRIALPCRSSSCRHNQCFDAESYLYLQEQGPTWLCPICNISAPFESLVVDEYVKDILKNTSAAVDQVTIQPDGKWELHARKESSSRPSYGAGSDSDDEIVEITKSNNDIQRSAPRSFNNLQTPVTQALRESSSSSSLARQSSSGLGSSNVKRPAAVIDLTSSGDEDEEPVAARPAKRQYQPNGFAPSVPTYRPPPPNGYTPRS